MVNEQGPQPIKTSRTRSRVKFAAGRGPTADVTRTSSPVHRTDPPARSSEQTGAPVTWAAGGPLHAVTDVGEGTGGAPAARAQGSRGRCLGAAPYPDLVERDEFMVRWGRALGVVAAATVLASCGSGSSPTAAGTSSSGLSPSPSHATQPTGPTRTPPASADASTTTGAPSPTKVLVFMVENHSLGEMRAQMPWTAALADRYGYATSYHAMTHPSLPNYLAIAGGSTFGVTDDRDPSSHPVSGPSVFGEALAAATRPASTPRRCRARAPPRRRGPTP